MTAQRELIMQRFESILASSGCFDTVVRNDFIEDDSAGRIAMLWDGDEEPLPNTGEGKGRPVPGWAQPVAITPEVYILTPVGEDDAMRPVDIGPWLIWATSKLKFLITHDAELLALLYSRDPIIYDGAESGLATGRSLAGEVSMKWTFRYVERFEDPGAAPLPTPESTEPP